MRSRLFATLGLTSFAAIISLAALNTPGNAQDLGKNNAEIKKRIEFWKTSHPVLLRDIDFTEAPKTETSGGTAALFIGVNRYFAAGYGGQAPKTLGGCVNDARTMLKIAKEAGLDVSDQNLLLDENATRQAVLDKIDAFALKLKKGDLLLITFAGHGGEWADKNGDEPADHPFDQTWCLHDRMIIDDELAERWSKFADGVRIVVFADSCNSGTSTKFQNTPKVAPAKPKEVDGLNRKLEEGIRGAMEGNAALKAEYDGYGSIPKPRAITEERSKAGVLLLAATKDGTNSLEFGGNGLFTSQVRKTWEARNTTPVNSYSELFRFVRNGVIAHSPAQQPVLFPSGPTTATDAIAKEKPFQK